MTDVTRILNAIEQGDAKATDELLPLVYEELRLLAAQKLSHEAPGQTLQATALIHRHRAQVRSHSVLAPFTFSASAGEMARHNRIVLSSLHEARTVPSEEEAKLYAGPV